MPFYPLFTFFCCFPLSIGLISTFALDLLTGIIAIFDVLQAFPHDVIASPPASIPEQLTLIICGLSSICGLIGLRKTNPGLVGLYVCGKLCLSIVVLCVSLGMCFTAVETWPNPSVAFLLCGVRCAWEGYSTLVVGSCWTHLRQDSPSLVHFGPGAVRSMQSRLFPEKDSRPLQGIELA